MVASERLRLRLALPESLRGQMMLGALAPDAHTETEHYDRTWLHPTPGTDPVAYVVTRLRPPDALDDPEGRAFALSVTAHLLGDEMFRRGPELSNHAPLGLIADRDGALDLPGMREDLTGARPRFGLEPLTAREVASKRTVALERPPLAAAAQPYAMAPELARAMDAIVARTITLAGGTALLDAE